MGMKHQVSTGAAPGTPREAGVRHWGPGRILLTVSYRDYLAGLPALSGHHRRPGPRTAASPAKNKKHPRTPAGPAELRAQLATAGGRRRGNGGGRQATARAGGLASAGQRGRPERGTAARSAVWLARRRASTAPQAGRRVRGGQRAEQAAGGRRQAAGGRRQQAAPPPVPHPLSSPSPPHLGAYRQPRTAELLCCCRLLRRL